MTTNTELKTNELLATFDRALRDAQIALTNESRYFSLGRARGILLALGTLDLIGNPEYLIMATNLETATAAK